MVREERAIPPVPSDPPRPGRRRPRGDDGTGSLSTATARNEAIDAATRAPEPDSRSCDPGALSPRTGRPAGSCRRRKTGRNPPPLPRDPRNTSLYLWRERAAGGEKRTATWESEAGMRGADGPPGSGEPALPVPAWRRRGGRDSAVTGGSWQQEYDNSIGPGTTSRHRNGCLQNFADRRFESSDGDGSGQLLFRCTCRHHGNPK